jgi:hypothetical protein
MSRHLADWVIAESERQQKTLPARSQAEMKELRKNLNPANDNVKKL